MALSIKDIKEPDPQRLPSGEEHGLVRVMPNSVPDNEFKRFKEKDREMMRKLKEEESRMVKVTYINRKSPDKKLEMTYCRWDGDHLLGYKFIPDHTYLVPKGLVDMVNGKKRTMLPEFGGIIDPKTGTVHPKEMPDPFEHQFISAAAI